MQEHFRTNKGILYQGDCLDLLKTIHSEVVDCVFADPPFNIGKDYRTGYDDNRNFFEYYEWCAEWIAECSRVLKPGGSFFLYALPELNIRFANILNNHLDFRHWIALSMKGTFRRGKRLYPAHYSLLYYTKGEPNVFNYLRTPIPTCRHCGKEIPDYGGHREKMNSNGVNLSDFWADTSPNRHKKFKVRSGVNELKLIIPERAILMSTNQNDVVLDPFGGGGTTYHAAQLHNRRWIGIELYDYEYIRERMDKFFPLFVETQLEFELDEILDAQFV